MSRALLLFLFFMATQADFDIADIPLLLENFQSNYDISQICSNFTNSSTGVVESCKKQLDVVCRNKTLLLTMFDATSKFPYPGLKVSSRQDFGNYDECIEIEHFEKSQNGSFRILGKHCYPGFFIPVVKNESDPFQIYMDSFKLSICIPDQCSANDLQNITGLPFFVDVGCLTKETSSNFSVGDIVIIIIFAISSLAVIISTAYDVYLHYIGQEPIPIYASFSFYSNGKKLFQTTKHRKDQILVFHGLKFISIWWIMAGHTFLSFQALPFINENRALSWKDDLYTFYISSGYLAVDTFFYISGFLFSYQYFKQANQSVKQQLQNIPIMYLHRYLRLTPALLMCYFFFIGIAPHLIQGPLIYMFKEQVFSTCYTNWWAIFLYIQNYHNPDNICMVNTWFLSADMQLFLLAPLVAIPVAVYYKKDFKNTMIALFIMNLLFIFVSLINVFWQDLYQNEYATHTRLINYGIGFMMGLYMREKRHIPFKLSQKMNIFIWACTIGVMLADVLIYKEIDINNGYIAHQIFYSLMRTTWCMGLCWIVYSCYHGYGGFVNWILTLPAFQVGSKLTYCMYLIHMIIIGFYLGPTTYKKYFSDYNAFYEWCGHFILSFVGAIMWTLAFESPMIILEKNIFEGMGKKPSNPSPKETKFQVSKEMSLKE